MVSLKERLLGKKSIYLNADGTPKTIDASGRNTFSLKGISPFKRNKKILETYWKYYQGVDVVFASINTIAWNTIMVGYYLTSDNEEAKKLIETRFNEMDIDSIFLDNVLYALVYGDAFIEKVMGARNARQKSILDNPLEAYIPPSVSRLGNIKKDGKYLYPEIRRNYSQRIDELKFLQENGDKPKGYISYVKTADPITMEAVTNKKTGEKTGYKQDIFGEKTPTIDLDYIIQIGFFPQSNSPYHLSLIGPSLNTIERMIGVDQALYQATIRHGCYDDKTEILTENGWKLFKDLVKYQEKVATYNPDTKSLEYKMPEEYVQYDWNGCLDSYQGRFIDLVTTPDHDHYISYDLPKNGKWETTEFKKTSETRKHYRLRFKAYADNYSGNSIKVPEEFSGWNIEQYLRFLGYYISEGSLHHNREIVIHQSEGSEILPKLQNELSQLPLECHEHIRDRYDTYLPGHEFRFYSSKIGNYLGNLGKHNQKYIPKEYKNLSRKNLKILFDALMDGDGHKYGEGLYHYYTTSKQLADDVQEIALKLGYATNLSSRKRNDKWDIEYSVRCRKTRGMEPTYTRDRIERVWYDGVVYCVRVPNHLFFVRRNGKVIISGNTPKYHIQVGTEEDPLPPKEVYTSIKNDMEDINANNEFTTPKIIEIKTIDERGVPNVNEYANLFQKKAIVGLMCPEESIGMSTGGSTEATASVREIMFERYIQTLQHKLASIIRKELINPLLVEAGFDENIVYMKFRSVTTKDEEGYAKWFGNLLRGFQFVKQKPITVNEIRDAFHLPPRDGGDDLEWGGKEESQGLNVQPTSDE